MSNPPFWYSITVSNPPLTYAGRDGLRILAEHLNKSLPHLILPVGQKTLLDNKVFFSLLGEEIIVRSFWTFPTFKDKVLSIFDFTVVVSRNPLTAGERRSKKGKLPYAVYLGRLKKSAIKEPTRRKLMEDAFKPIPA